MELSFPSQFSKIALACTVAAVLASCVTSKPPQVGAANLEYQCLPVPSEWKEAGSIFSVDTKGDSFRIGRVDGILALKSQNVGFPTYTSNSTFKVGFLVSTLEKLTASTGWSATVGAEASNKVDVSTYYNDLSLQITEGQPEAVAINWFKAQGYHIEPGYRYYLVREAIQAKEVSYEVKRGELAKMGGEIKVKELVSGKLDVFENNSNDSYVLKTKFSSHVNVCIKPRELFATGMAATGQQILSFKDVTHPISITGNRE